MKIRTLSEYPVLRAIYDAMQAVEACGASPALTAAVIAVGDIKPHVEKLLDELESEGIVVATDGESRICLSCGVLHTMVRHRLFCAACVANFNSIS